jgi:hypothetical protein
MSLIFGDSNTHDTPSNLFPLREGKTLRVNMAEERLN